VVEVIEMIKSLMISLDLDSFKCQVSG